MMDRKKAITTALDLTGSHLIYEEELETCILNGHIVGLPPCLKIYGILRKRCKYTYLHS